MLSPARQQQQMQDLLWWLLLLQETAGKLCWLSQQSCVTLHTAPTDADYEEATHPTGWITFSRPA